MEHAGVLVFEDGVVIEVLEKAGVLKLPDLWRSEGALVFMQPISSVGEEDGVDGFVEQELTRAIKERRAGAVMLPTVSSEDRMLIDVLKVAFLHQLPELRTCPSD